ncbi:MAG: glycosyltransferase family 4 protein [Gammaproteobacteria bacterium]|nr:glycosyltransferase family 4 protein [Gammaproteobacteria bacterium]
MIKKILFVHHGSMVGGAPVSLRNTVAGLREEGFDRLQILCAFPQMKPFFQQEQGVDVGDIYSPYLTLGRVFVGLARLTSPRTFMNFFREILSAPWIIRRQVQTLKREQPDVVHLNSSILFLAAVSAKLAGIPLVWHVREVLIGGRWNLRRIFTSWFIRRVANVVICISETEAKSLGSSDAERKVRVIYNFIDIESFRDSSGDAMLERQKYGIGDEKVVLSLGGVSFRKGTVELIQAADQMKKVKFLIAGHSPPTIKQNWLRLQLIYLIHWVEDLLLRVEWKQIYSWHYEHRVALFMATKPHPNLRLLGKVDQVAPLINLCDVLIFAGCTPHFPRPVYEAWSLKKPVVVFDVQGVRENVTDGVDGVICDRNDAAGLLRALSKVKVGMGEAGYRKSVEKFERKKNVKKIVSVYHQLFSDK